MRAFEILLEYDRSKTLSLWSDKIIAKLRQSGPCVLNILGHLPDNERINDNKFMLALRNDANSTEAKVAVQAVLNQIESTDPTNANKFVSIILRWYISGDLRYVEDLYKAKEPLETYVKFKNRIRGMDLNRVSFLDFARAMDVQKGQDSQRELSSKETESFYQSGQAQLWEETPEYKIVIPKTKEASIYFGKGTRWCTAATGSDNYFNYYNNDGPLYIIMFKGGTKWQFHFQSASFMDAEDEELEPEDILDSAVGTWFEQACRDNLTSNPDLLVFVTNISREEIMGLLKKEPRAIGVVNKNLIDDDMCRYVLDAYPAAITAMSEPTEEDYYTVAEKDPTYLVGMFSAGGLWNRKALTKRVVMKAIEKQASCFRLIDDWTEEEEEKLVTIDGRLFEVIMARRNIRAGKGGTSLSLNTWSEANERLAVAAITGVPAPQVTYLMNSIYHFSVPMLEALDRGKVGALMVYVNNSLKTVGIGGTDIIKKKIAEAAEDCIETFGQRAYDEVYSNTWDYYSKVAEACYAKEVETPR